MARAAAAAVVALLAGLALTVLPGAGTAAAEELPVNALAPDITETAGAALAAFDHHAETGQLADYLAFAELRAATARLAARQLGYDEFEMIMAWQTTTASHQRAVLAAMTQLGVPYRTNTSKPGVGFDCSGLTSYAWAQAGEQLVRFSGGQIREAEGRDPDEARAGDLVHYPGHVMMYLGVEGAIVHSPQTGRTVEVDTLSERRRNSVRFGDPIG